MKIEVSASISFTYNQSPHTNPNSMPPSQIFQLSVTEITLTFPKEKIFGIFNFIPQTHIPGSEDTVLYEVKSSLPEHQLQEIYLYLSDHEKVKEDIMNVCKRAIEEQFQESGLKKINREVSEMVKKLNGENGFKMTMDFPDEMFKNRRR